MGSLNLLKNAKNVLENTPQFKQNSQSDWVSGWTGKTVITQCLMIIILLFGIF